MSVIANNLMSNETILKHAVIAFDQVKYKAILLLVFHGVSYLSNTFLTIIAIFTFIPAIIIVARLYLDHISHEFVLTNQRVIAKHGYFSHEIDSLPWPKVESVTVYQGLLGRKLNYGIIKINGVGGEAVLGGYLENPSEFRKSVIKLIESKESHTFP